MIAHTSLSVSDYLKAKSFYSKALEPLGYSNNMEYGEAAGFNDGKKYRLLDQQGRFGHAGGCRLPGQRRQAGGGFLQGGAVSRWQGQWWPGLSRRYWPGYYAAFVTSRRCSNIEAVWYYTVS